MIVKPQVGRLLLITLVTAGTVAACTSSGHAAHQSPAGSGPAAATSAPTAASASAPTSAPTGTTSARTSTGSAPAGAHPSSTQPKAPYPTPSGPEGASLQSNQAPVLNSLPGGTKSNCAVVGSHTDLRSGSVAAGDFVVARKSYTAQVPNTEVPTVFLYLIPQHAGSAKKAVVTVQPLGAGKAKTVTSKDVEEAGNWRYFALNLPIANPGNYRLTMVTGVDHGCFEVTFKK